MELSRYFGNSLTGTMYCISFCLQATMEMTMRTPWCSWLTARNTNTSRTTTVQLLYDHKVVLRWSLIENEGCPGYELEIELLSNRKLFKRSYRFIPQDVEIADKLRTEMLDAGVIEPSRPTCADVNSPIFLVNKTITRNAWSFISDNLTQ